MAKVLFPVKKDDSGEAVFVLQSALVKLGFELEDKEVQNKIYGPSTLDAILNFQKSIEELEVTGIVDEATARKLNELLNNKQPDNQKSYQIRGSIIQPDGSPVKDIPIQLFQKGIRKNIPLGPATHVIKSDADGIFLIEYPNLGKVIDVLVKADTHQAGEKTRPKIISNVSPNERVIFIVGDKPFVGKSRFELVEDSLGSVLNDEGIKPEEIVEFKTHELAQLSHATGIVPRDLILMRQAYRISNETGIDPIIIHGIGKQGISLASISTLLTESGENRREAVVSALATKAIPSRLEKDAFNALTKLDQLAFDQAIQNPSASDITSIGTVLLEAQIPPPKIRTLAKLYTKLNDPESFWKKIRESQELTETQIQRVQFELQLSAVTQNHMPLNVALRQQGAATAEDLAIFSKQDLRDLITGEGSANSGTDKPAHLKATGVSNDEYAEMVFRTLEDALPTEMVAHQAAGFPQGNQIRSFIANNPDYSLRSTPVYTYLQSNPNALDFVAGADEKMATENAMKRLERAYRIAAPGDRIATTEKLLTDGLDSATKIRAMGRAAFVRLYESKLGSRDAAIQLFRRANNAAALAATVATRHAPQFNSTPMFATAGTEVPESSIAAMAALPSFSEVFGSPDYCACEHCQSVFSPAAYLVDLLNWLEGRETTVPGDRTGLPSIPPPRHTSKTGLDVLFHHFDSAGNVVGSRRSDIGTIDLSCTNTNTPLPYIDIVNEVLELQVTPSVSPPNYQTTGSAGDLRAHPENLRREAYETLAGHDAVYPFNLPFNFWLEEARSYLPQLGISRHSLMESLLGTTEAQTNKGVAIEVLRMSPREWDLIADNAMPAVTIEQAWGREGDPDIVNSLSNIDSFVRAADSAHSDGIPFSDLSDLLRTNFVQRAGTLGITFNSSTCDTENASFDGLTQAHLSNLHRFIRLQQRLGWYIADLDRAIDVVGSGTLDEACVTGIAHLSRLSAELNLSVASVLDIYGSIDTRRWAARLAEEIIPGGGFKLVFNSQLDPRPSRGDEASSYDKQFLDPSLAVHPANTFEIIPNGTELLNAGGALLASQLTPIAAALGATADELNTLIPLLAESPAALNLANLSSLHQHIVLARALDVSITELVTILALTGIDAFDASNPAGTLDFIRESRTIQNSNFTLEELNYLLRHVDSKPSTLEPDDTDIGVSLFEVGAILRKTQLQLDSLALAVSGSDEEVRQALLKALSVLLSPERANEAIAFIDVDLTSTPTNPNPSPNPATSQFIDNHLAPYLDKTDAKPKLSENGPALLRSPRQRLVYLIEKLHSYLHSTAKSSVVVEKLSSELNIETAVCSALLKRYLQNPDGSGESLLQLFTADSLRDFSEAADSNDETVLPGPAQFAAQFAAYKILDKTAILFNRLSIDISELDWVMDKGPRDAQSPTLNPSNFPVESGGAPASYAGWRRLVQAVALRDQFSPNELFDLCEASRIAENDGTATAITFARTQLVDSLIQRSRWARHDLEFLIGTEAAPGAMGYSFPADWKGIAPILRLAEVMQVVQRVGLAAQTIWQWRNIYLPADGTPGELSKALAEHENQAGEIKQAVRARYETTQWYEIAPTLRDPLRERQRDSLLSWLLFNDQKYNGVEDIFNYLLLDVEMSACQLTSRIKQATSTVQLYVQRLLLGLELDNNNPPAPLVSLAQADGEEWQWRKNYRVWEANRKVFLYPENYLEPELRDDKTPLFIELENELLQNEITDENAEAAVNNYLERLSEIARLEIVGLCEQQDDGNHLLHVFGRTRGTPANYYHRTRVNKQVWTPWEAVDVGIEGNQILPVVFNRRLYVFWLMITEAALEEEQQEIPSIHSSGEKTSPTQRYYEIRLSWSQRQSGGWSAKKIATPYIGEDLSQFINDAGLTPNIVRTSGSTTNEFFLTSRIAPSGTNSPSSEDLYIKPIRYIPTVTEHTIMASRRLDNDPDFLGGGCGSYDPGPDDDDDDNDDDSDNPVPSGYYRLPEFRFSGCDNTVTLAAAEGVISVAAPSDTIVRNQTFARTGLSSSDLKFPAPNGVSGGYSYLLTFNRALPPFEIVPPQIDHFRSTTPFFYQDRRRTFFIDPGRNKPWNRHPADWINEGLGLEMAAYSTTSTRPPPVAEHDPWHFDSRAEVLEVPTISKIERRKKAGNGSLAARTGNTILNRLGSRVNFLSNETVDHTPSEVSLSVNIHYRDTNGNRISDNCASSGDLELTNATTQLRYTVVETFPDIDTPKETHAPSLVTSTYTNYRFEVFYYPHLCAVRRELNRTGLPGLYSPSAESEFPGLTQQSHQTQFFQTSYSPTSAVRQPYPLDEFDFDFRGTYSIYNWEVFFHMPLSIACQLSQHQRFSDAQRWFHFIFNPTETSGDAPKRFWRVKPLAELFNDGTSNTGPVAELLLLLQYQGTDPKKLEKRDEIIEAVATMRSDPSNPHIQARLRLAVYARVVVLKYIDNLIDWGDQLFRRDSMESINEATQLYFLAEQLLGRRPRRVERGQGSLVDPSGQPVTVTFDALRSGGPDELGNTLVEEIEGLLPEVSDSEPDIYEDDVDLIGTLLFCVPPNDNLVSNYWDRVADRLFKIRHCMNIEGTTRQLPLFEPPMDPSLLVRAKSAGIDLASVLSDLQAPLPNYRYAVLSRKAAELCADVRGLGQALLAALEKKDAEEMALLRADHQVRLETSIVNIRERQIDEAKEALEALRRSRESAEIRRDYYRSRRFANPAELSQFSLSAIAGLSDTYAGGIEATGALLSNIPDSQAGAAGFGGAPYVTLSIGGSQFSFSTRAAAASLKINSGIADRAAQLSGLIGSYQRRDDEWQHQGDLAGKELETIEHQLIGAELRVAIAEYELSTLKLQLNQSKESDDFLKGKYTNTQLYQWMSNQLSSLHFQAYQLAFDLAKRAERAWQFEIAASSDRTFVQFGHWDGLKQGLLAGERLHQDLQRMDVAYLGEHNRELELTQHISIRELNPEALLLLKRDGVCHIEIPEDHFDLVYPGHYMRRLKNVAISLPSVTGPYASVPCTLTLESGQIRTSPDPANPDPLRDDFVDIQSIVTSQGIEDTGLFETNLRDERYLPFEGAGAINSKWRLELPTAFRQFDYESIYDAIIHLRYTARDGGPGLRDSAIQSVQNAVSNTPRLHLISAKTDFPDNWNRFLSPPVEQDNQSLLLTIDRQIFPYQWHGLQIQISSIDIFLDVNNVADYNSGSDIRFKINTPDGSQSTATLNSATNKFAGMPHQSIALSGTHGPGDWVIQFNESDNSSVSSSVVLDADGHRRVNPDGVDDLLIVVNYTLS